jgi:hypothetical protein
MEIADMKFAKPILILAIFIIADLAAGFLLKSIHPVVFSIVGGIGVGYLAYTLILLFVGGWLARYIFRLGRVDDIKQALILSGMAGVGVGTFMAALIGVTMLLL